MAKKKTNISINALEKFCKYSNPENVVAMSFPIGEDQEITCEVKKRLTLDETMHFIESVVSEVIMESDMLLVPIAREFISGKNILTYYANFSMPTDTNKAYDLVMGAWEIIAAILNTIDMHQYSMIQGCINERIEFEKQKMLAEQQSKLNRLSSEITNFSEKMSSMFDNVNGDQMAQFITGMADIAKNKDITTKEIAAALVEKASK